MSVRRGGWDIKEHGNLMLLCFLLEFYSVVRILFFAGKKEVEAFLYGAVCRCSDFSGNGDFYAGQSHPLWSFDITWQ